jgi:hypothetical protein
LEPSKWHIKGCKNVSEQKEKKYKVSASEKFVKILNNLPDTPSQKHPNEQPDQHKVVSFIQTYLASGMDPALLRGKIVNSDNVPRDDKEWLKKVKYAQLHKLWHYHIGIPFYVNDGKGYLTSGYVLHYQQIDDAHIKLVDLDWHPPMTLPSEAYLEGNIVLGDTSAE